jgi:hypothetical protein
VCLYCEREVRDCRWLEERECRLPFACKWLQECHVLANACLCILLELARRYRCCCVCIGLQWLGLHVLDCNGCIGLQWLGAVVCIGLQWFGLHCGRTQLALLYTRMHTHDACVAIDASALRAAIKRRPTRQHNGCRPQVPLHVLRLTRQHNGHLRVQ